MSIETNLNVAPYFDDYTENSNYYKILFRPGVSVQARELTQIQDILQTQVERFGNHVFKSGTIVSGVNFQFYPAYSYVKLLDNQADGQPAIPTEYVNYYAKNAANVQAKIINAKQGLQSTDPDTNYLYLNYINSGDSALETSFANSDVLTIFSKNYEIFDFNVVNGGTSFSNSDTVQITSALLVSNSSIDPNAGISQVNGTTVANVYVYEANNNFSITLNNVTYTSNDGYTLLKIKPHTNDLANSSVGAEKWTITNEGFVVQGSNSAYVVSLVGTGASAVLTTDSSGVITDVSLTNPGTNYIEAPYVTVRSSTGTFNNLEITPQMFKAQVLVADSSYSGGNSTPVGNAYAFGVTEGIIYQKGFFLGVNSQITVVNSYSTNVNSVSVGFITQEAIVNTNVDSTLLDNATGTPNFAAPGANRLKFIPTLSVVATANAESNNTFFPLVEFREGQPYKQYKNTLYNILSKEFERRTTETSGNFVVDPFIVSTKDQTTWSNSYFNAVSDPGILYIDGVRVDTQRNTFVPVRRSNDTYILEDQITSINYGSYVLVKELAGFVDTDAAPEVSIYGVPYQYYTKNKSSISFTDTVIGTAKVRSIVYDSGTPGTSSANYRMYLFDVSMRQGYSFSQARSIYYNGVSYDGVADLVLERNNLNKEIAVLKDPKNSSLLFDLSVEGVKSVNSVTYGYRSAVSSANISSNGVASLTISDQFIYGNNATLSANQRKEVILVPLANAISTNTATVELTRNNKFVIGDLLDTYFKPGDSVYLENSANDSIYLYSSVASVSNNTYMVLNDAWPFDSNTSINVSRYLPGNVPVPLDDTRVSVNTNSTGTTLYVNLNGVSPNTFSLSSSVPAAITYNAIKTNFQKLAKLVSRNNYVKICLANNVATTKGPWCLGIPDAFRLNRVFIANSSTVNTNSTVITDNFYIDNGQTSDYYGHAHLAKRNSIARNLSEDQWLLVEFDAFYLGTPSAAGFFSVLSYPLNSNNSTRTAMGNTSINIVEIPEFKLPSGKVLGLENALDFRPRIQSQATYTSNPNAASVNPANTRTFYTSDKLFPIPDSNAIFNYEAYLKRKDRVVVSKAGNIKVVEGTPAYVPVPTEAPADSITISILEIPSYPSLPKVPDSNVVDLFTKRTGTASGLYSRHVNYTVKDVYDATEASKTPKRYTMGEIGNLESRIKNLEYYTSLNLLDKKTKDINIPSSINPSLDRTKYGYFVDNFNDYLSSDINNKEMTAYIDQEAGRLIPQIKSFNLQARFNYDDSTTLNSLRYSGNVVSEPAPGKWSEHVLMLPSNGEINIISQNRFTSAVNGTGGDTKFVGDMITEPGNLRVAFKVAVKQVDTTLIQESPAIDVTPDDIVSNTNPRYVLSASKREVTEGSNVSISFITVNVANGTSFDYAITGANVTSGDISVPLTGTLTVEGNTDVAYANLQIDILNDFTTESLETMVFTVNTSPTTFINVNIVSTSSNTEYRTVFTSPTGTDSVGEGQNCYFTFTVSNPQVNTYPYSITGIGITNSDITISTSSNSTSNVSVDTTGLGGTLTINSTGGCAVYLSIANDAVVEGSEPATFTIAHPAYSSYSFVLTDGTIINFPLSVSNSSIDSGTSATFVLTSSGTITNGTKASYTISGVEPLDINVPLSGDVTFNNNYANLTITANSSSLSNGIKTLLYTVTPPSGANYNTTPVFVSTNIRYSRDDSARLICNVNSITETSAAGFTLTLANGYSGSIPYTIAGSAGFTSGDIDTSLTGNITVSSGTGTLNVTALNNANGESNETFTLTIPSITDMTTGQALSRSVIILADPTDNSGRLTSNATSISETNTVRFTLTLANNASGSFAYTITGGAGFTSGDINTSLTGNITVTSGTGTLDVTALNNASGESDETFTVTVAGVTAPGGGTLAQSVTIAGDTPVTDNSGRFTANATSITETNTARFTLTLANNASGSFAYTITGGAGFTSGDINTSLTGNITVTSGTGTLDVTALNNASGESDETFTVTVAGVTAPGGGTLAQSVTIKADPAVSYSLQTSGREVQEGGNVVFTLVTTGIGAGTYQYNITPTTNNGDGITQTDFVTPLSGTITVTGNTTLATGSVTVTVANDIINEADETFAFTVSGTTAAVTGSPSFVTIKNTQVATPTLTCDKRVVYAKVESETTEATVTYTLEVPGAANGTVYPYQIMNVGGSVEPFRYKNDGVLIDSGSVDEDNNPIYVLDKSKAPTGSVINKFAAYKWNLKSINAKGTLTINNGKATKQIPYFRDDNDGAGEEYYLMRVQLGTVTDDQTRGSNDLLSPATFIAASTFSASSIGTLTCNFNKTSVAAGNTFTYKASIAKGIDAVVLNYNITGVVSDDICGAPLSGQLITRRANTADISGVVDTYATLSFTSNANLTTNKNIIVTATALNNQLVSPAIVSSDTLLIAAAAPATPLYNLTCQTIVGTYGTGTSTKPYGYIKCYFNTSNIAKSATLTVKLFNETQNKYVITSGNRTITAKSTNNDFSIALNANTPTAGSPYLTTYLTTGILFSVSDAIYTGYKTGDMLRVEIYSGSTKIAEAKTVAPNPTITGTQPSDVLFQKIGYA